MDPKLATWNKSITFQSELIVIIQSCTVEWIPKELSKKAKSNPLVLDAHLKRQFVYGMVISIR